MARTPDRFVHASLDQISTIIGRRDRLRGDLHVAGGVRIDGVLHGNVEPGGSNGVAIVSEGAYLEGRVKARSVRVSGHVTGTLLVEGHVDVTATACIEGDIHYGSLIIEPGAKVTGRLTCLQSDEVTSERAAG